MAKFVQMRADRLALGDVVTVNAVDREVVSAFIDRTYLIPKVTVTLEAKRGDRVDDQFPWDYVLTVAREDDQ